ncbi:MAG: hypothetical protein LBG43_01725 [Treponema sp.]|nr:hypothetical protein [Treponema sp.]
MTDNKERETLQVFGLMLRLILKGRSPPRLRGSSMGCSAKSVPPGSGLALAAGSVGKQADRLGKIISDMAITTGGALFLREAQINDGANIGPRIFQYGFVRAVPARQTSENVTTLMYAVGAGHIQNYFRAGYYKKWSTGFR